ncbi:hypothetical protein BJV82DRAFT_599396 [Fennellomyces sp. T-0311]|nr:hypothetical protein BJV82DRAFT_599396 [Fennellomyces sp. T-0311]
MASETIEYRLPGAYHYRRPSDKEDEVSLPLAIVSSVLFPSEGIMVQTTHTSLPGAWVKDQPAEEDEDTSSQEYDQNIDELRRTVAELRRKAEQLEQADVMVKKGIEIVARKRQLAQHKRRRQSEWDWCDSSCDETSDDEPHETQPKKKTLIVVDDEGGEWEIV